MPITGPIETWETTPGFSYRKVWYRGGMTRSRSLSKWAKPRRLIYFPLPLQLGKFYDGLSTSNDFGDGKTTIVQDNTDTTLPAFLVTNWVFPGSSQKDEAYAKAFDKFVALAKEECTASVGVTALEARESITMITDRTKQLADFVGALARKDFKGVIRALRLTTPQKGRAKAVWDSRSFRAKSVASQYLEFIFGWKPLVDDIGKAVEVLQQPKYPPDMTVKGRGSAVGLVESTSTNEFGFTRFSNDTIISRCYIRADVTVLSENVLLANRLGFINPVQVAWQVMPLSFLVDWFIPIGKFLGSYTDLSGFQLDNVSVTHTQRIASVRTFDGHGNFGRYKSESKGRGIVLLREVGFDALKTVPTLASRVHLNQGSSLVGKAVSTIALATQVFSSHK